MTIILWTDAGISFVNVSKRNFAWIILWNASRVLLHHWSNISSIIKREIPSRISSFLWQLWSNIQKMSVLSVLKYTVFSLWSSTKITKVNSDSHFRHCIWWSIMDMLFFSLEGRCFKNWQRCVFFQWTYKMKKMHVRVCFCCRVWSLQLGQASRKRLLLRFWRESTRDIWVRRPIDLSMLRNESFYIVWQDSKDFVYLCLRD